ncbi:unnamed protein product [Medioppia subpectinata]|uniref:Uncharacterized protein n=1 Tax=Medioppia subpectinata TaxID=1979941 RepID=A0A7R9QGU4_9ACAR|nr:unnamed protein product [Medioppia subpectinata]CAG2119764.1 unnamed protein product [Medioppia subpectinata]
MRFSLIYALVLTILCLQLTDGQKPTPKPKKAGPPGGPIKKRSFSDGEDKGIIMTMFDGSVSFLENLRRQYKFGFSKDDRRRVSMVWFAITADIGTNTRVKRAADETEMKTNVDTAMDTDPEDKTLQVVGDGSVWEMVWKNKSYDGGRSYELIAEYQVLSFTSLFPISVIISEQSVPFIDRPNIQCI